MFALKPVGERQVGRRARAGALAGLADGVLPRILRRPVRALSRLDPEGMRVPRFAGLVSSVGLLSAACLYGAVLGGHMPAILKGITAHSGFAINDVRISGNRETSEIDVLQTLDLDGWTSLIGFDAEVARERVAAMPWVESASVRKVYPDAIEIQISEKRAFAIWQRGSELVLVERSGAVIAPFGGDRHARLPLVVGTEAAERARAIIAGVADHPDLASRVKGYVLVAGRRWDLHLEGGVTLMLPESGERRALAELAALDAARNLLSRDITSVDLRIEDRMVVKLTPEAVVRREAALKQLTKKRGGRSI